ncbi:hypothetical protein PoB_003032500 [Plakobranchus ocellatus]|uniref:Mutator-like transposase domain-containing protein n=1 Tax=Plakobranchus ocellatus TaxID=259542 RepID=A0AAV4A6M1_9GAST|nr:hypothetical protein PoB_003032500 [Plakobranchus ocellatus]
MPKKRFQQQRKHLEKARAQRQQAGEFEASPQPAPEQPVPEEPAQESLPSTSRGPDTSSPSTKRMYIPLSTPPPASPIAEEPILTRSEQKLALSQRQQVQSTDVKRTIVELPQLAKLLGDLRCHACLSEQGLTLEVPKWYGLAVQTKAVCTACNTTLSSQFTPARNLASTSCPKPFATNEAVVMASLMSGMGPYLLSNLCEFLEMPDLHQKTFNTIAKRVYSQNERLAEEVFGQAASFLCQKHIHYHHLQDEEDAILDISVSFDGSWLTCGHKSLIGIGCVIDVLTDLIINGHVLSPHCHVCAQMGAWIKRETPLRYEQWRQEHIEKGECTINFEGSSL